MGDCKGYKLALLHSEPYSVIFSFTGTLFHILQETCQKVCSTLDTLEASGYKNIYLSEDTNDIIGFLIGKWTSYLCAQDLQRTTTDTEFTRKLLLYLRTHHLADKHTFRLYATFQDTGQVKHQPGQNFNFKCLSYLNLDQFDHVIDQRHGSHRVEKQESLAERMRNLTHQFGTLRQFGNGS